MELVVLAGGLQVSGPTMSLFRQRLVYFEGQTACLPVLFLQTTRLVKAIAVSVSLIRS